MVLAYVQRTLGHQEEGLASAQRALALSPQLSSAPRKSVALGNVAGRWYALGFALKRKGNTAEGHAALEKAVDLGHQACAAAEAAGARRQNLSNLNNLAGALTALQRHAEALAALQAHGALAQEPGLLGSRPNALVNQVRLLRDLRDLPAARVCILDAVAISNAAMGKLVFPLPHLVLSELDEAEGDYRSALANYKRFVQLETEVEDAAADLQARILSIRLNADMALREAEHEHHRADALQEANANLQAEAATLEREALQDALTGLANRRLVDRQLKARHAASLQAGQSACVAFMDVDRFKRVNDVHSHAIGDRVLVELARLFESHCREGDLAGRYGGEEIVLSFSRATLARAKAACERLRLAVQGHDWDTVATGLRVTISMGLADTGKHANLADGLAAAHARLYAAKREGRNRVCIS